MSYRTIHANPNFDDPVALLMEFSMHLATRFNAHAADITPPVMTPDGRNHATRTGGNRTAIARR